MSWKHVLEAFDLLDDPAASGERVAQWWRGFGMESIEVTTVEGDKGATDFVSVTIPGTNGKSTGGEAPTLGIVGRLGGLGARPERIGFVSDGDGALTAVSAAASLADMARRGDHLPGDVIVATHIDPDAPTRPHDPVPFMDGAVAPEENNRYEVSADMDAILSVDTTKGNRICNHRGFALTPTVKSGYILRVSEDLLSAAERASGLLPVTIPITTQDITPYGNGIYHMNSILQPAVATSAPVVGVAITTQSAVPGSGTGATDLAVVDSTVRFVIEVAKDFTGGAASFYDEGEFDRLDELYGSLEQLQTLGRR